jgi:poly-gamma-glutamate capsule biosynthesis protein CapA/YwtB (metallophosphatase superfamily)
MSGERNASLAGRVRGVERRVIALLIGAGVALAVLLARVASAGTAPSIHMAAARGVAAPGARAAARPGSHPRRSPGRPVTARRPRPKSETPITIAAVGDTMMGSPQFGLPPADGRSLFSATHRYLRADVSIVDQEGTLTNVGPSKCAGSRNPECFAFKSPPAYAANLTTAGFTVANLADNHTLDYGQIGLTNTEAALRAVSLRYTGLPGQFAILHVHAVNVAVLGFAPYAWCADSLDLPAVRALVERARREAELVIVYFHAGAQGADETHVGPGPESVFGNPQGDIRVLAHTFVDAGADLVIGTGPHVLRGIQFYRGKLIDYSLGNFLGYRGFALGGTLSTSAVLQATITAGGQFVSARLRPVELDGDGVPVPGGDGIELVRTVSGEDFGASAARISATGVIAPPVRSRRRRV